MGAAVNHTKITRTELRFWIAIIVLVVGVVTTVVTVQVKLEYSNTRLGEVIVEVKELKCDVADLQLGVARLEVLLETHVKDSKQYRTEEATWESTFQQMQTLY